MIDFAEWAAMAAEHAAKTDDELDDQDIKEYQEACIIGMADVAPETLAIMAADMIGVIANSNPILAHSTTKALHDGLHSWIMDKVSSVLAAKVTNAPSLLDILAESAMAPESGGASAPE